MKKTITAATLASVAMISVSHASQADDYANCLISQSAVAIHAGKTSADALDAAFLRCDLPAGIDPNELEGIGDFVNMQVEAMDAGRPAIEHVQPASSSVPATARLDLKGIAVDERVSVGQVEQTLGVRCGATGIPGAHACSGDSTVADYPARVRATIMPDGTMRDMYVSFHSMGYEKIYRAFVGKFGEPHSRASLVQNGFGTTFQQEEHVWGTPESSIRMKRYAGNVRSGSISFSGVTDREFHQEYERQKAAEAAGDL